MMITMWRGGKRWRCCLAGVMLILLGACERERAEVFSNKKQQQEGVTRQGRVLLHPAQPVLERHLDAYKYQDEVGALKTHLDGTQQTPWCEEAFTRVLAEVAKKRSEESCARARVLSSDAQSFSELDETEQLMTQTLRYVCERGEQASCLDYAGEVYRSALEGAPLWRGSFQAYRVEKMYEDGEEVTAYIEVIVREGGAPRRATARLRRVSDSWRVAGLIDVSDGM